MTEGDCSGQGTGTAVLQAPLLPYPTWKAPLTYWEPRLPWHLAHPTSTQACPLLPLHVPTST